MWDHKIGELLAFRVEERLTWLWDLLNWRFKEGVESDVGWMRAHRCLNKENNKIGCVKIHIGNECNSNNKKEGFDSCCYRS